MKTRSEELEEYLGDDEETRGLNEAALAGVDRAAALELCMLMHEISEELWCAQWLLGLDALLWPIVAGGELKGSVATVALETQQRICDLSATCGGWWAWIDPHVRCALGPGPLFVPRAEWELEVARREAARVQRGPQ